MKNKIFKSKLSYTVLFGALALLGGCQADFVDNGITPKTALNADFTITKISQNKFTLTSSNNKYLFSDWDLDEGFKEYTQGNNNMTLFLPDAGTYTLKHRVIGAGGVYSDVVTKTVTVDTSDPIAYNLVQGGRFENATDIGKWTVDNLGGVVTFADGWVKFTNNAGSWGQAAIQQPITVVAGKKYEIDMLFKTGGLKNGWFKVYACTTKPTAGVEYKGDILVAEVAIWGDNIGPKKGRFSSILNPDSGTKTKNFVTFTQSGTIYLSIQCGAENLKDGVSISRVELRAVSE